MARSDAESERGYRVTGRVQGVGFRWWTRRVAGELGVRGTVRNCADGSVELRAVGTEGALGRLEASLRRGPPGARVDAVTRIESGLPLPEDDFIIGG